MLHAYFYTICLVFRYTSWRFHAISRTNLLRRCHSASSLFFCYFCVSEKLHRKYPWNWTKQVPEVLFCPDASREPKRRWSGAMRAPHTRLAWPRPWPRHLGVRARWQPPDDASSPIRSLGTENPKRVGNFPEAVP
jgi:hypothetical protein